MWVVRMGLTEGAAASDDRTLCKLRFRVSNTPVDFPMSREPSGGVWVLPGRHNCATSIKQLAVGALVLTKTSCSKATSSDRIMESVLVILRIAQLQRRQAHQDC